MNIIQQMNRIKELVNPASISRIFDMDFNEHNVATFLSECGVFRGGQFTNLI